MRRSRKPGGPRFQDRSEAGRVLAGLLGAYAGAPGTVVLGLPRGGVPVAFEVARALGLPLDVLVVRKLGLPGQEELAMGAIAHGGARVLNHEVLRAAKVPEEVLERVTAAELAELERRERGYRADRPAAGVEGRTVILVDDGLATGSTMRAAAAALRELRAARIVVAVPVASGPARAKLAAEADEVVCAALPVPFLAVGQAYHVFGQTGDDEVRALLREAGGS